MQVQAQVQARMSGSRSGSSARQGKRGHGKAARQHGSTAARQTDEQQWCRVAARSLERTSLVVASRNPEGEVSQCAQPQRHWRWELLKPRRRLPVGVFPITAIAHSHRPPTVPVALCPVHSATTAYCSCLLLLLLLLLAWP